MAFRVAKGRTGVFWDAAPEEVLFKLTTDYGDRIRREVRERMLIWAEIVRDFMVENAPWQDRSGKARAGLDTDVGGNQHGSWLILFHKVPYGVYLEGFNPDTQAPMAAAGRWAIIEPTIDIMAPLIWNDIWKEFQRK